MNSDEKGMAGPADLIAVAEYQIVRPDGTVLLSATAVPGTFAGWSLPPEMAIQGPCAARWRVLPDDESWTPEIYFPDGYPGRDGDWPDGVREKLSA